MNHVELIKIETKAMSMQEKEYKLVNSVPKRIIKLRLSAIEMFRINYVTSELYSY